jgi:hypothetical protein
MEGSGSTKLLSSNVRIDGEWTIYHREIHQCTGLFDGIAICWLESQSRKNLLRRKNPKSAENRIHFQGQLVVVVWFLFLRSKYVFLSLGSSIL